MAAVLVQAGALLLAVFWHTIAAGLYLPLVCFWCMYYHLCSKEPAPDWRGAEFWEGMVVHVRRWPTRHQFK
jgi:hypothetical protein